MLGGIASNGVSLRHGVDLYALAYHASSQHSIATVPAFHHVNFSRRERPADMGKKSGQLVLYDEWLEILPGAAQLCTSPRRVMAAAMTTTTTTIALLAP